MKNHTEVKVYDKKTCDFCGGTALYDFKTAAGPWANGCAGCWAQHRYYRELGLGKGQKLIYARRCRRTCRYAERKPKAATKEPEAECPDSPTGKHEITPDLEYDSTGAVENCNHCGISPDEIAALAAEGR